MSDTFTKKVLSLTITLGTGTFGEDVGDTVTLTGFRMTANAKHPGGDSMGMCQIRVFGLLEDVMNKLTTIGAVNRAIRTKNAVLLAAGDEVNGMQSVFQGTIFDAWADYNSAPDVAFNILAYAGLDAAVKPVDASSFKGSVAVVDIMSGFAVDMSLTFENAGVDVKLSNPYFPGTTLSKVRACAQAADILWSIDRGVLAIWPRTQSRAGSVPQISSDTGMVGYPALSSKGMTVKMLFNWNIKLGGDVAIVSSIPMANGTWRVFNLEHDLSCEMPDGPWFTNMDCYNVRP
jgi:hypothetical protein